MTAADIILALVSFAMSALVGAAKVFGITIEPEIVDQLKATIGEALRGSQAIATAKVFKSTDTRPEPEPGVQSYCPSCGWKGGVGYPMPPGAACPGLDLVGRNCRKPVERRHVVKP